MTGYGEGEQGTGADELVAKFRNREEGMGPFSSVMVNTLSLYIR